MFMASKRHYFSSISVEDILTEEMQLQQKLTQNSNSEEETKKIERKIKYRRAMVEILNGNSESLRSTASKFNISYTTLSRMLEKRGKRDKSSALVKTEAELVSGVNP